MAWQANEMACQADKMACTAKSKPKPKRAIWRRRKPFWQAKNVTLNQALPKAPEATILGRDVSRKQLNQRGTEQTRQVVGKAQCKQNERYEGLGILSKVDVEFWRAGTGGNRHKMRVRGKTYGNCKKTKSSIDRRAGIESITKEDTVWRRAREQSVYGACVCEGWAESRGEVVWARTQAVSLRTTGGGVASVGRRKREGGVHAVNGGEDRGGRVPFVNKREGRVTQLVF
ncbi:hypothetical protein C8R45DRAFT_938558 [Mycena sanguinolenta]|nr:hypothetical protein C8R45DRAFT_938558 [Mycena sanguinolenta]